MVSIKKPEEIKILKEGGALLARTLQYVAKKVAPGVNICELNAHAEKLLRDGGGSSAFLGYRGSRRNHPYPSTLCVSINDEVVHGIGTRDIQLKEGDIVGLDIGVRYPADTGLYTDMAVTVAVARVSLEKKRLMQVARTALERSIAAVTPGVKTTDLSKIIQSACREAGYSPVRNLTGHGVGYAVHEDPLIFCYYEQGMPETVLQEGMVIAIEPMVCAGTWRVTTDADGWTIRTLDGKPAAHFEHTVVVTGTGHEILTVITEK